MLLTLGTEMAHAGATTGLGLSTRQYRRDLANGGLTARCSLGLDSKSHYYLCTTK
jgi:hypothetical protein